MGLMERFLLLAGGKKRYLKKLKLSSGPGVEYSVEESGAVKSVSAGTILIAGRHSQGPRVNQEDSVAIVSARTRSAT